jgi:hypothetical protein
MTTNTLPDEVRERLTVASRNHLGAWGWLKDAIDALRHSRGLPPDDSHTPTELAAFRDDPDVDIERETRAVAKGVLAGTVPMPLTREEAGGRILARLDGSAVLLASSPPTRGPKLSAEARALAELMRDPDATDAEIARRANVSRPHLYRMPKFRVAREIARAKGPPNGVRRDDGDVDAWNERERD